MKAKASAPSFLLILGLIIFPQISETIYTPSLPDLATSLSVDMSQIELTLSIYFLGFALGVLVWGFLADRIGRRLSMLGGLVIYLLGNLGCRNSNLIDTLLLFRFVQAFGASTGSIVTQTMIRDLFSGKERNRIFAVIGASLSISPAFGPLIGGYVDQFFGWRSCFTLLFFMGIVLLGYSYFRLSETKPLIEKSDSRSHHSQLWLLAKQMILDPKIIGYSLLIGSCNGVLFGYYGEAPYLFIEKFGLTPSQYGWLGIVIASSFIIASSIYHRWMLNFLPGTINLRGSFIVLFGALLFRASTGMGVFTTEHSLFSWFLVLTPILVIFIGIGILIPNCLSNALTEYQANLGMAGSLLGLSYYIIIAGCIATMSALHNGESTAMPNFFIIMSLFMSVVSVGLCRQKKESPTLWSKV